MNVSASQVVKVRRCERAYAFEYVEDIKAPSSPKQMFGSQVHSDLEKYLKTGDSLPDTMTGKVAKAGLQWLPPPGADLLIEHYFTFPWTGAIDVIGYIDCVSPPGYSTREPLVIDHKTTSDLRWAKTPEMLEVDAQAILYALWAMLRYDVEKVRARWVYYAATNPKNGNRVPRGTRPVEVIFDALSPIFQARLAELDKAIKKIAVIRTFERGGLDLPPSPEACSMYEGCFYANICSLSPSERLAGYMEKGKVR